MPRFNVLSRETVYYSSYIEANSEEEAIQKVYDFGINQEDAVDSDFFQIDGVYLEENTNA